MSQATVDSPDLEALFDSIADEKRMEHRASSTPVTDDSELESLFDSIADEKRKELRSGPIVQMTASERTEPALLHASGDTMFERLGTLTRQLHDALRELGYDQALERAAKEIPETRDRLGYIARLTGQAAERALAAVEVGQALQREVHDRAERLSVGWEKFFAQTITLEEFRALAYETRLFMAETQGKSDATNAQLTEIMMAQDFHDLTGQVINKMTGLIQNLEGQLLKFVIESAPADKLAELDRDLEGPVINAAGRGDVVTDQAQVDDLLESLGF